MWQKKKQTRRSNEFGLFLVLGILSQFTNIYTYFGPKRALPQGALAIVPRAQRLLATRHQTPTRQSRQCVSHVCTRHAIGHEHGQPVMRDESPRPSRNTTGSTPTASTTVLKPPTYTKKRKKACMRAAGAIARRYWTKAGYRGKGAGGGGSLPVNTHGLNEGRRMWGLLEFKG